MNYIKENLPLFLPSLIGFSASAICPIGNNSGLSIKARPPGYIFGIVWPVLFITLGIGWNQVKSNNNINLSYLSLCLLGWAWIYFYGCQKEKKLSLYIILLMILNCYVLLIQSLTSIPNKNTIVPYTILPYLLWLQFALLLNFEDVNSGIV
jgi:tryptophan-rich sensory protein